MKRNGAVAVALLIIVAACGGGDDEAAPTTTATAPQQVEDAGGDDTVDAGEAAGDDAAADDEPSLPADAEEDGEEASASGSESDFCRFASEVGDELDLVAGGFDADSFRAAVEQSREALATAQDLAPAEISGDIALFVEAYDGFVSLLEEYDYDLTALALQASDDPRLLAFETEELAAASRRIGAFCGADLGFEPDEGTADGDGDGGDGEYGDVPDVLVPPDIIEAFDMGPGTVLFRSGATFEEIVDFYTQAMGEALFVDNGEQAGVWQARIDGVVRSVNVSAGESSVEILVARIG